MTVSKLKNFSVNSPAERKSTLLALLFLILGITLSPSVSLAAATAIPSPSEQSEVKTATTNGQNGIIDFNAPPQPKYKVGKYLSFGGRTEFEFDARNNFDLDDDRKDKRITLQPLASLSTAFQPHEKALFFLNMSLLREFAPIEEDRSRDRRVELNIGQAYLRLTDIIENTTLTVGRQRFVDEREWLFDSELDAVRLTYQWDKLFLDFGLAWESMFLDTDLISDDSEKRVNDYIFKPVYYITDDIKVSPYIIYRHDYSPDAIRHLFFGIHSSGKLTRRIEYSANIASSQGKEKRLLSDDVTRANARFGGIGFDLSSAYRFKKTIGRPSVMLGYAFGSAGDESPDSTHRGFRQTGLQNNSGKVNGVSRINYYGELMEPELSNLHIITAGTGIRPIKKFSWEVLYHYYLQHRESETLGESRITADPDGSSRQLGSELDFVIALKNVFNFDVQGTVGLFMPGKAFSEEDDTTAFFGKVKARYNF